MMPRSATARTAALAATLLAAAPLRAQHAAPLPQLPDSIADRVIAIYNASGTSRLTGELRLARGNELRGTTAVIGGPVVIGGRVDGTLVVINGELRFESGAEVTGETWVVGGAVAGQEGATLRGPLVQNRAPLLYRFDGPSLVRAPPPSAGGLVAGREFAFGRVDVRATTRNGYNRVEGLPIAAGPRLRFGRSNPTSLEVVAIYRTASGLRLRPNRWGYTLRAEQFVGGGGSTRIGARLYSEIVPIEERGLLNVENALTTFVLHRDYRDYYEVEGWAAYVRFARAGGPADLTVEYRHETHAAVAPRSPWTLFDNDEPWRPSPLAAEGRLRSVVASWSFDTRNETTDAATGWHLRVAAEQGVGGRFADPPDAPDPPAGLLPKPRERFSAAELDLRRYVRLSPYNRAAARLWVAGAIDGTALPPQRQRALGGAGTLPGFDPLRFDCGARRVTLEIDGERYAPAYGCDRAALFQLEHQAGFPFLQRAGEAIGLPLDMGQDVRWVAFFDLGWSWTERAVPGTRLPDDGEFAADLGVGVRIGPLGAYVAVPVAGGGSGVHFFARLGRRL
jgi:hypothetical protein